MYSDLVESQANRSVKERLDRSISTSSGRRRSISGKRQSENDNRWEHDLFDDKRPRVSKPRIGKNDLRLKLQNKTIQKATPSARGSSGGIKDLREKLSGVPYSHRVESESRLLRPKPASEVSKSLRRSVIAEAPAPETKKIGRSVSKKKTQQNVESLDYFLRSLDLLKYSITFQAEEVDMTTLLQLSDEDLKAMGIPMGPRKKILLALDARIE